MPKAFFYISNRYICCTLCGVLYLSLSLSEEILDVCCWISALTFVKFRHYQIDYFKRKKISVSNIFNPSSCSKHNRQSCYMDIFIEDKWNLYFLKAYYVLKYFFMFLLYYSFVRSLLLFLLFRWECLSLKRRNICTNSHSTLVVVLKFKSKYICHNSNKCIYVSILQNFSSF